MEEHTRETLEEVADVVFHGQLEEKRPWLLLVLVSLAPSVPQDVAFGADHIRRLEDDGAILAEVVRDDVVLRGTKHGEDQKEKKENEWIPDVGGPNRRETEDQTDVSAVDRCFFRCWQMKADDLQTL